MATLTEPVTEPDERERKFRFRSMKATYIKEWGIKSLLFVCDALSDLYNVAIVVVLFTEATLFFRPITCIAVLPWWLMVNASNATHLSGRQPNRRREPMSRVPSVAT